MIGHTGTQRLCLVGLLLATGILAACGVSQEDFDELKQELAAKDREGAQLKQELAGKDRELASDRTEIEAIRKSGVITVSRNVPPRPTATPVPPGFVAPPAATPVPLPSAKYVPIAFHVETVTSGRQESPYAVDANPSCVAASRFARGARAFWRVEAVDTSTGKVLQSPDVKSFVVKVPGQEDKVFRYARHLGPTGGEAWFWGATWDIPPEYPLGVVDFTIEVVTADSKTGTWKQWQYFDPVRDEGREPRMQIIP